jgi:tRNA dimethylallyltransferase
MLKEGLIDEIYFLEKKYGRTPIAMGAIGVKETLDYLDGKLDIEALKEKISTHTAQLAKRQITFNKTQFPHKISDIKKNLINNITFSI